jgi:aspartate aminotransferase-like enzyme
MIPGPVEVAPEVIHTMGQPIHVHYGTEWTEFFTETRDLMKQVMMAEKARLFLIPGPGTSALDASINNTISDGKEILILSNGYFGNRFLSISKSYVRDDLIHLIESPLTEPIDPDQVETYLSAHPNIRVVTVVHCETSTGILNPVKEIAEVCSRHDSLLIVDGVTGFGGAEFRFDEWDIGICITASQKSLGLFPGLAPIAISERAWELIEQNDTKGWYLNFKTWQNFLDEWGHWHPHPVTMPANLVETLNMSCKEMLERGLEKRWADHRKISNLFRRGLSQLGFDLLASDEAASPTITTAWADERLSPEELIEYLKEHHNILIAGGLDDLHGKIIRVGHMGPTSNTRSVLPLLYGIADALSTVDSSIEPDKVLASLEV